MAVSLHDIVKLTSTLSWNAAIDIVNVWFLKQVVHTGDPTNDQVRLALETWVNSVFDNLKTYISGGADPVSLKGDLVHYDPGTAKIVTDENLFLDAWDMSTAIPTGAGETLPTQIAAVVTLRTERPKTRGRKFLGPMVETASGDGGALIGALQTALAAAAVDIMTDAVDAASNEYTAGVVSPYSAIDYFYPFTTGSFNPRMCTHRSRRFGVGE